MIVALMIVTYLPSLSPWQSVSLAGGEKAIVLIPALAAGFVLARLHASSSRQRFDRNPLSVNGLGALGAISSATDQASSASVQASTSSDQASTALVEASFGSDEALGRPLDASLDTDQASFVAFELPSNAYWSRFASDQASSASVQACAVSVEASGVLS